MLHLKKQCIKNGQWNDGEFRCKKCGKRIALAYKIANEVHIWKFPMYKKYVIPMHGISFIGEVTFDESIFY